MSEEDKHKLSKIIYYSDIRPVDIEFINNIIYKYNLEQENKQLKEDFAVLKTLQMNTNNILNELEEWLKTYKSVGYEDIGTFQIVLDKIQELKEKYNAGDKE